MRWEKHEEKNETSSDTSFWMEGLIKEPTEGRIDSIGVMKSNYTKPTTRPALTAIKRNSTFHLAVLTIDVRNSTALERLL